MLSFRDPRVTKELMVADMIAHAKADALVRGAYGKEGPSFRGCAVGCSIHTINRVTGKKLRYGDHAGLAKTIGAPDALIHLQDRIFEGLPLEEANDWPRRFFAAIPKGVDLTPSVNRISARILREIALPAVTIDKWGVRDAVEAVATALETSVGLIAARAAADAAVYAASYAAYAAAGNAPYAAGVAAAFSKIATIVCEEMTRCGRVAKGE